MLQSTNQREKRCTSYNRTLAGIKSYKQMIMGILHNQSKLVCLQFDHISEAHYILFHFETIIKLR